MPVLLESTPTQGEEMARGYREWNGANAERLIRPCAGIV